MQIVQEHDDRRPVLSVEKTEVFAHRMERPVAKLDAIVRDTRDMRVGTVVEADQLADERDVLATVADARAQALRQFRVRHRLSIVVEDLEAPAEQRSHETVGHLRAVRRSAPMESRNGLVARREPPLELEHQSCLAVAGVADERDH